MDTSENPKFATESDEIVDSPQTDAEELLTTLASEPFNIDNPQCTRKLHELWEFIFVDEPVPELPADFNWKKLGFQSRKPQTDFRGVGVLSLDCLLYMASTNPAAMRGILDDLKPGKRYPFVPASINICALILCHLRLSDCVPPVSFRDVPQCTIKRRKQMMALLSTKDARAAFGDLFIQVMLKLHQVWLTSGTKERSPDYTDFGPSIKLTAISLRALVNRVPKMQSTDDFASILEINPEAWSTYLGNGWAAYVDML